MSKLFSKKLTRVQQDEIIQHKVTWILAACQPSKIVLVGSAATYDMTDGSDVDLVIIFDEEKEIAAAKPRLYASRSLDDWPHDLLFYTHDSFAKSKASGGGVAWVAAGEGKILFSKDEKTL